MADFASQYASCTNHAHLSEPTTTIHASEMQYMPSADIFSGRVDNEFALPGRSFQEIRPEYQVEKRGAACPASGVRGSVLGRVEYLHGHGRHIRVSFVGRAESISWPPGQWNWRLWVGATPRTRPRSSFAPSAGEPVRESGEPARISVCENGGTGCPAGPVRTRKVAKGLCCCPLSNWAIGRCGDDAGGCVELRA